ncbi:MAG: VirB4-like conjugal transfer ATPase, CD1110 family [Microbacterium sp.]|uniref:VirB4-like conjugal transfer ATPase, CD1110 family n=1 Tax=Microbacterium sp. TaxID=51671 RepID=UPI003F975FFE
MLGYKTMLPSGTAWLGADEWSITCRLSDINYVASAQTHQQAVLDRWASVINSFGAGTRLQLNVINRVLDDADASARVSKQLADDGLDYLREDFNRIVREKLVEASGNTVTDKYLTITVQEPDQVKAEATLTNRFSELAAALQAMEGCQLTRLNRSERLEVFSQLLRPHELFTFNEAEYDEGARRSTADYVAPWAIKTIERDGPVQLTNGAGDSYHSAIWVRDYPSWLSDRLITELTEIKCNVNVSLHLEPYDQVDGMTLIERQISEMEMQTINERKKAQKQGIGDDMIPRKLVEALDEARELRRELATSNQKVFSSLLVIGVTADSEQELEQNLKRVQTTLRKVSIQAEHLRYMQLDGLTTALPVGRRMIPMRRTLTTASAAIIVPFTTQELYVPGGTWYGVNAKSSNALVADRTKTTNGNGFILGTSGSGKGVFGKSEIANVFLDRDDDILIVDPEREYEPLVTAFGGTTVRLHPGSVDRINPLDIDLTVSDDTDPIRTKVPFVLNLLAAQIGGLTGSLASTVDRILRGLYQRFSAEGGEQPTLATLRQELINTTDPEALGLANALELYTDGSLDGFSRQTTVDTSNRIVSYDISKLGDGLKSFGMMVILDQIWTRVHRNHVAGRRTWIYIDEFHMLFRDAISAEEFRKIWARIRKYGGIPTGITQNIEDVLANNEARIMLANSDFLALLGQSETDADSLTAMLNLSDEQRRMFHNVLPGQGLLRTGGRIIGFDNRIPQHGPLYELYQTSFSQKKTGRA